MKRPHRAHMHPTHEMFCIYTEQIYTHTFIIVKTFQCGARFFLNLQFQFSNLQLNAQFAYGKIKTLHENAAHVGIDVISTVMLCVCVVQQAEGAQVRVCQ